MDTLDFFERLLYEAPGNDPPPDIDSGADDANAPPDISSMDTQESEAPPDTADIDTDMSDEAPPDLGDDMGGFGDEDMYGDDQSGDENNDPNENLQLNDKVSAIMNQQLYQRFLALLNNITGQLTSIKNNNDVLFTISPESLDITYALKKLDECIHMYLDNDFVNNDYSKNRFFFNKCINLLALLNKGFDKNIRKGIKDIK